LHAALVDGGHAVILACQLAPCPLAGADFLDLSAFAPNLPM
jgi:hypothetical protein